ncbi:MAG: hypothetical protein R3B55_02690 [Candidatus Paceibacterota bacterium]
MKTLITLLFLFTLTLNTEAQKLFNINNIDCEEIIKKREYRNTNGKGTLLHISCKDRSHFFFLIQNKTDTAGIFLNENYEITGKNLKVTSSGPSFFVVKRKYASEKYQYNFSTNSWNFDKITPPSWSTGDREEGL